jgi:hypothetical protein
MKSIRDFLKKPYPYYYSPRHLPVVCLVIFLLAFGFVYFFMPFNVNFDEHKHSYLTISLLQALLPAIILFSFFTIKDIFMGKRSPGKAWTMGKELKNWLLLLMLMGGGNFLLRDLLYDNPFNWSARYFWEETRNAYMVGGLILSVFVPLNLLRLESKNLSVSAAMNQQLQQRIKHTSEPSKTIFIHTGLKSDDFHLDPQKLLFIRAEGNYLEFVIDDKSAPVTLLKRITLKDAKAQLASFPWIIQTHRKYLVNIRKIERFAGNAQGCHILLPGCPETIPVSRGHYGKVKRILSTHPGIA